MKSGKTESGAGIRSLLSIPLSPFLPTIYQLTY